MNDKLLLVLLLCLLCVELKGHQLIDDQIADLQRQAEKATSDTARTRLYLALAWKITSRYVLVEHTTRDSAYFMQSIAALGNYKDSGKYLEEVFNDNMGNDVIQNKIDILATAGRGYYELGQQQKAALYADSAYRIARRLGAWASVKQVATLILLTALDWKTILP